MLDSLEFSLYQNEVLGVIGPNGAGKTVMLDILTGILKPQRGSVIFMGRDITRLSITERIRIGLGRTFQIPRPFENMTVAENILTGCVYGAGLSEKAAKKTVVQLLELIGLELKANSFAGELNLLDRKRLEIGRALATEPKVLMLDEVAGGLTDSEMDDVFKIINAVRARGTSVIWIEHVLKTMLQGTDRVLCISEGRNIICGDPLQVLNSQEVAVSYLGSAD